MEVQELRFETFQKGAGLEVLNDAIARCLENLADPNTDPEVTRAVSLTIKIKADAELERAGFSIEVHTKLASAKSMVGRVYLHHSGDGLKAYEQNPRQMKLDMEERSAPAGPVRIEERQGA